MAIGIRGFNPIWLLDDLQANLFDDTFYMYVLENTIPYIPEIVWHDPNLNVPWTSPIQFLGNGTLPNDIYFEDNKVYRLEFRQNDGINPPSQADALIYEVNNYIPGGRLTPDDTDAFPSSNQITNPQFALINFSSPLTLTSVTNPDPIEIAPGWFLELAGTGSVTVSQVPLNDTNKNPSNAPYALRLVLTGWDADGVFLRQRFQQNGMLWANKTISSAITARVGTAFQSIYADLVPSTGTPTRVLDVPTVIGSFVEYTGYGTLPDTTNSNTPPAAYIDYKLGLPSNADMFITSIQLIVQDVENLSQPSFEQDSINRQIDHTFNYFKPKLMYKPITSYLVGWDFPLNPSQFFANGICTLGAIGINKSGYVWDQTIAFQNEDNVLSTARNSASKALNVTIATSPSTFALIQYIPLEVARILLSQRNSIQIKANVSAGTLNGTVSLWWNANATLPDIKSPNFLSLVSAISPGAIPVCGNGPGTWVQVTRGGLPAAAPFTLNTSSISHDFTGFDATASAGGTTASHMAIVIAFDIMLTTQTMALDYCSLVGGDIATRPAPQTLDQVLRECQYYYRKSFLPNTTPATNVGTGTGESYALQSVAAGATSTSPIVRFDYPMINTPAVLLYNPAAANSQIRNETVPGNYSGSGASAITAIGFFCQGTSNGGSALGNVVSVHWTADARLGTF